MRTGCIATAKRIFTNSVKKTYSNEHDSNLISRGNTNKRDNINNTSHYKTIYVYPGKKVVCKVLSGPIKSKFSYGVEIEPWDGTYWNSKEKRWYNKEELKNYRVILNLKEDEAKDVKKGDILVKGIDADNFVFLGDENGSEKTE